jgi:hypothetical protein
MELELLFQDTKKILEKGSYQVLYVGVCHRGHLQRYWVRFSTNARSSYSASSRDKR